MSVILLPRYFRGEQETAYAFLGHRFGDRMRALASVTFMLTRLLADGVRLFATAIPLKVIALSAGWDTSYAVIIIVIGLVTVCYTFIGGLKAVVWMDTVQMFIYVGGAVLAVFLLLGHLPADWLARAVADGKTQILNTSMGLTDWLTQPYTFVTALVGGTVFSMASHGGDQLIVQRILACRSLKDGQRAMIWSGVGRNDPVCPFPARRPFAVGILQWRDAGHARSRAWRRSLPQVHRGRDARRHFRAAPRGDHCSGHEYAVVIFERACRRFRARCLSAIFQA